MFDKLKIIDGVIYLNGTKLNTVSTYTLKCENGGTVLNLNMDVEVDPSELTLDDLSDDEKLSKAMGKRFYEWQEENRKHMREQLSIHSRGENA